MMSMAVRHGRPLLSSIGLAKQPARSPAGAGRSRIATCGRLFEGTDENSLGQTCSPGLDLPPKVPEHPVRSITPITAVTFIWND